ncbi:MAG TPA: glycosyltransferase family 39 protein [Abditibacteriaceae bacterium]|nr:glycosyltransferase family 39 protein [Abditibacteriaceae bacterium]
MSVSESAAAPSPALRPVGRHTFPLSLREKQVLLAILASALILRLVNANAEYWFDEIIVVQTFVRGSLSYILQRYEIAGNQVLYSAMAHVFARVLGEEPWAVRLPSILFGAGSVWAFFLVARQLWSARIALLGTFLFAFSYYHIYYSQNARGYTSFLFFALLAASLLMRMLTAAEPQRRDGAGYAVAIGVGLYALLLMAFVVVAHGCVLIFSRRRWLLLWLLAGLILAAALYAPMGQELISFYRNQAGETGHQLMSAGFLRELSPILPLLVPALIVGPLLLARLARRQPAAAALIVLPLVFTIALPAIKGGGLHPRTLIYALPVAYLFLTEALDWLEHRQRWAPWIVAAVVIVASLAQLAPYYRLPKQGFQQALAYIEAHRKPQDQRLGLTLGGKAARFYDPSLKLVDNVNELRQWLKSARQPTWIIYTFASEMRDSAPQLHKWVETATTAQAEFPGVVGDGTVHVQLWQPKAPARKGETPQGKKSHRSDSRRLPALTLRNARHDS